MYCNLNGYFNSMLNVAELHAKMLHGCVCNVYEILFREFPYTTAVWGDLYSVILMSV